MDGSNIANRELAAGSQVGKYTIIRRLARGGMAEVYLAKEDALDRLAAVKLILPQMADEAQFLSMFKGEARIAATLSHPNIAQTLDAGEVSGEPFLAMEYVHGKTVHSLLRAASKGDVDVPLGCGLALVTGACAGLHYAHERRALSGEPLNIVHRDVSPSNLMCRYDGTVKLLDFGIAKAASQTHATAAGFLKGKSGYMSPEQCADEPIDRRSDVFNLGILLYELTTAHRAFYGDNPVAVINKIANARFTRPRDIDQSYPVALEKIVLKALEADPALRYQTAAEMQQDIEAFARTRKLDTSTGALGALMMKLYGDQPYPAIPTEPDLRVVAGHTEVDLDGLPTVAREQGRSASRWVVPLVGGGLAAVVFAAWSFSGAQPEAAAEPPQAAAPAAKQPAPAPEKPRHTSEPADPGEPASPVPQPEVAAPEPEPEPEPVKEPRKRRKTKTKSKPKPKAKRKKAKTSKHRSGPEGMYP